MPLTMTRVGSALLALVGGACLAFGCSGSTARDINFNSDASENGFQPPLREAGSETTDGGDIDATAGAAGEGADAAGAAGDALSDGENG